MIQVTYNYFLVSLSIIIAIFGSYVALDLGARIKAGRAWIFGAAACLGISIWSMHFVAMLSYQMGMPVSYDATETVASLVIAMVMTGIGFAVQRALVGGILMGLGIASMHYTGMAAMRMAATPTWNLYLVAASVAIAIAASATALRLYAQRTTDRIKSSCLMGLAIAGMHYTGMAAVSYTFAPAEMARHGDVEMFDLAIGIWVATMVILGVALGVSMWDRSQRLTAER